MNKKSKRILAGIALMFSVSIVAGCGTQEKIGYVNSTRIVKETQKGVDIQAKMNEKRSEILTRLQAAQGSQDEATFAQTQMQARQEMQVFQQALESDFENSVQAAAAVVAKDQELTMVTKQGVVVGNGIDITDEVVAKMGKVDPNKAAAPTDANTNANTDANAQNGNGESQPTQAQQ
ncbi:OmpH family outer membrane protein [uncultured Veillonella sp.]|uniref:OmpH family outer membrane protein n=1 Tax=uncultured Veillonella sp. TaxID=159268 RepID=UPI0025D0CE84|nr:OmpH family outer membrane protein [uncultured Veillonella sp.]MDY3974474.1 OmpH family outer membrane protein [Veillonella caviae]